MEKNAFTLFRLGVEAGLTIQATELPQNEWGKTLVRIVRTCDKGACEIIRGELCTAVVIRGLNNMSDALKAYKVSPEYSRMRDIQMRGCSMAIAYANF